MEDWRHVTFVFGSKVDGRCNRKVRILHLARHIRLSNPSEGRSPVSFARWKGHISRDCPIKILYALLVFLDVYNPLPYNMSYSIETEITKLLSVAQA